MKSNRISFLFKKKKINPKSDQELFTAIPTATNNKENLLPHGIAIANIVHAHNEPFSKTLIENILEKSMSQCQKPLNSPIIKKPHKLRDKQEARYATIYSSFFFKEKKDCFCSLNAEKNLPPKIKKLPSIRIGQLFDYNGELVNYHDEIPASLSPDLLERGEHYHEDAFAYFKKQLFPKSR